MRQAAVYLRVSTLDQTTANQERELRDVAARMGIEIVKVAAITAYPAPKAGISGLGVVRQQIRAIEQGRLRQLMRTGRDRFVTGEPASRKFQVASNALD